jgi:hypothetical protein
MDLDRYSAKNFVDEVRYLFGREAFGLISVPHAQEGAYILNNYGYDV